MQAQTSFPSGHFYWFTYFITVFQGNFFQNIGSIILFSVFGTAISAFIVGGGIYFLGRVRPTALKHLKFIWLVIWKPIFQEQTNIVKVNSWVTKSSSLLSQRQCYTTPSIDTAGEAVGSPSLEILKSSLDTIPGNVFQGPCRAGRVEQVTSVVPSNLSRSVTLWHSMLHGKSN